MKNKLKVTKFKGGGYVEVEKIEPGVTFLSMNAKGWYEMFAKPLMKEK